MISRKGGHKWLIRFAEGGAKALVADLPSAGQHALGKVVKA